MTLQDSIIQTLLLWNTDDTYKTENHDFVFVQFLLVAVYGLKKIECDDMEINKMNFIRNIFNYRVKMEASRYSRFTSYVLNVRKLLIKETLFDSETAKEVENVREQNSNGNKNHSFDDSSAELMDGFDNIPVPINLKTEDTISAKIPFIPHVSA